MIKKAWETTTGRIVVVLSFLVIFTSTFVFYFEHNVNDQFRSFFDSIWWAFVTMTTVGYGDKVPQSSAARVVAVFLMFVGLGLLSVVTASISSIFVSQKIMEERGLKKVKLKNHILLCGWNHNILNILKTFTEQLSKDDAVVLINEHDDTEITNLKSRFSNLRVYFVKGSFNEELILRRASIETAKTAIILGDYNNPNSDHNAILATLTMKSIAPTVRVCVEILNSDNVAHVKRANADEIIVSGVHSGFLLANAAIAPGLPRVVEDLIVAGAGNKLAKESIPEEFVGRSFRDLFEYFRSKGTLLIGTITEEPSFKLDDLVSDDTSMIDNFIREKFAEVENEYFPETTGELRINLNPPDDYKILPADSAVVIKNIRKEETS